MKQDAPARGASLWAEQDMPVGDAGRICRRPRLVRENTGKNIRCERPAKEKCHALGKCEALVGGTGLEPATSSV